MIAIVWVLDNTVQNGLQIRQSFQATVAGGVMYRETCAYVDKASGLVQTQSEASFFVPGGSGALTWSQESLDQLGPYRQDFIFSAPISGGHLYLSLSIETDKASGNISNLAMSMSDVSSSAVGGVQSVNSQTGVVSLTTTNIPEGTNEYYTNARAHSEIAATILTFTSAASAGGGTSETLVVTGLLSTDTILAVSMQTPGATATSMVNGFGAPASNALPVTYTADPGAGLMVQVTVLR